MQSETECKLEDVLSELFIERLEESREEGVEEGIQLGIEQGERRALQQLLEEVTSREQMPITVARRIKEADNAQLRAWLTSLISGASPRQVFAEGRVT